MWTLKSKTASRKTKEELKQMEKVTGRPHPIGLQSQVYLEFVMGKGEEEIMMSTFISGNSPEEVEAGIAEAILQNLERLNGQEGVIEKVNTPEWVPERKTEEAVQPTPEQIKELEAVEARQQVEQAFADLEREIITKEEYSALVTTLRPVIKKEEVIKK